MADFFEKKFRHLIPNWRSFENTAKLGELNGSKSIELNSSFKPDISDLIEDWNELKNIGIAGDLLGAALVSNQETNATVVEVAKFVLENKKLVSPALLDAARTVLKTKKETIELSHDIIAPETFNDKSNLFEIHKKINLLKKKLINNQYNPINWVEIARYYSILGQEKKAERAIKNALFLAPENRFILRSVARFFVHIGDVDFAHYVVRNSELTKHDPWLLATEIALATLRDKNSKFTKEGFQIIKFGDFHPFNITELASSLATLELKNSRIKNSKKLFEQSLISPNDNSLAQAEWASQEEKKIGLIKPEKFKLVNSFEALARDFSEQKRWDESIEFSKQWFFDMPFSRMSVLFGSEIASRKLKDHNQAVDVAKLGLLSHPNDPHLLNNITYYLCLQNKLEEAIEYLEKVKKDDINSRSANGICLTATRGLYYFRKGSPEIGRQLYFESMKMSQEIGDTYLNALAFVNYAREEILIGTDDLTSIIPNLEKISKYYEGKDISNDAKEILTILNLK
mgnify:CR=1 FL=1